MAAQRTEAPPWVEPLRKILALEEAKGFDDSAVSGGLDRFVQHWSSSITGFLADTGGVRALLNSSYQEMSPKERSQWAENWRVLLSGLSDPQLDPRSHSKSIPQSRPKPNSKDAESISQDKKPPARKPRPARRKPAVARSAANIGSPPAGLTVDAPVNELRGVDTKLSARLQRLEVTTVRDLLYLFPRRHQDYSAVVKVAEVEPGRDCTVIGHIWDSRVVTMGQKGRLKATEMVLSDETGNIKVIWFGQGYLARTLKSNARIAISGKAGVFRGQLVFESPDYELLEEGQTPIHTGRITPVYPLTEGLTGRNLRRIAWQALTEWLGGVDEIMPEQVLARAHLMPLQKAIRQAHYPDSEENFLEARRRLAFDELLTLQLAVLSRRRKLSLGIEGVPIKADRKILQGFIDSLPFSLTDAQNRCVQEILDDLGKGTPPMNRLLQGEVGSGKTVVVLAALLVVAAAGYQGAVMVPTEVLAEQHFQTFGKLLGGLARPVQEDNRITVYLESLGRPVSVGLLTGSTRAKVRRELTQLSLEGNLDLLVGTHALIQSGVEIPQLALAVMDEQHRFGVMQRSALRQKGVENPHILVMSATPIPRTLSLTLYGDLDISTIDELPPGRQKIQTRWLGPERRDAAHGFVRKQVQEGRQAFVIYPLIDESEAVQAKAAIEEHKRLSRDVFPDFKVGLLHGRMSGKDKDKVMRQFRDGELNILVSTSVVEVGIDVANATVMLVDGADRFGLSQLHQFRGRVGRGEHKSYCILLSDDPSEVAKERLTALERIDDGFQLAEVDLELRGPGDFFGTRQSGLPDLRMARLSDRELLDAAREEATRIMEEDPSLAAAQHAGLSNRVTRFLDRVSDELT
ncbi:MAG: ATP-dependent DNA helicase RecG [Chloroflexi bacterium]|nr:ATP-dependent DNA helicase RecG [Chloroflexota bacterium]